MGLALGISGGVLSAEPSLKATGERVAKEERVTNVTVAEAKALLARKDAPVVIDIRTAKEFQKGHLAGAKKIDFRSKNFREELAKLDRDESYLLYCHSGWRSKRSLAIWKELGFRKVYHLDCGTQGWEKEKGEMVKGE